MLAKTFTYPDLNFKCTTPEGWNCEHKIGDVVHAVSSDKTKFFCLKVYKREVTRLEIQREEQGMIDDLKSQGYTVFPRAPLTLRGVSFDTFICTEESGKQTFRLDEYVGRFHGFLYQFELSLYDGIPSTDTELKSIVDSFDFINREGLPSSDDPIPSNSPFPSPARGGKVD